MGQELWFLLHLKILNWTNFYPIITEQKTFLSLCPSKQFPWKSLNWRWIVILIDVHTFLSTWTSNVPYIIRYSAPRLTIVANFVHWIQPHSTMLPLVLAIKNSVLKTIFKQVFKYIYIYIYIYIYLINSQMYL